MTARPLPDSKSVVRPFPRRGSRPVNLDQDALLQRAKDIFHLRRVRTQRFGRAMFGEPAWDMLLSLYIGERQGCPQTITQLTGFSDVTLKVALRWVDHLFTEGLVVSEGDKPESAGLRLS